MKKIVLLAAVAALFVGMLAVPASANKASDTGVTVSAAAVVGKTPYGAGCSSNPSGGGIGLPGLHDGKKAYYRFAGSTTSVGNGAGTIVACGQIDPVAGVGAACGMSAGNNGFGTVTFPTKTVTLSGVGWDASAGSVFVVTGNASSNTGKTGAIYAVVSAKGANCADKTTQGKNGTTNFLVDIVWEVTSGPAVKHTK